MGLIDRLNQSASVKASVILMAAEAGLTDDEARAFADKCPTLAAARAELHRMAQGDQATDPTPAKPVMPAMRARDIRAKCDRLGLPAEFADDLIDAGVTMQAAADAMTDKLAERSPQTVAIPRRTAGVFGDERATMQARMVDGLASRINPTRAPKAGGNDFAHADLPEIAMACLRNAGARLPLNRSAAVEMAMHSTSDFPLVLAGATQTLVSENYRIAIPEITKASREMLAPDYRARTMVRLSSGAELEEVTQGGEIEYSTFNEEGENAPQAKTMGKLFRISLQALKNDDLGFFDQLSRKMADGAVSTVRTTLCKLVEGAGAGQIMRDGNALFTTGRGNLVATGTGITIASVAAMVAAMRRRKGAAGEILAITPRFLIVAPEKEQEARAYLTNYAASTLADVNAYRDQLELIVEPGLTSATAWYLAADPIRADALAHCYLDDQVGPRVTSRSGWESFSLEMRVEMHFGASFIDTRAWHKNNGA